MVSEGVDIPRLRVGVFATTTTTELFFRQVVGRFVRWQPGVGRQSAHLFIPDDLRLRSAALEIAADRRHSLRREDRPDRDDPASTETGAEGFERRGRSGRGGAAVPLRGDLRRGHRRRHARRRGSTTSRTKAIPTPP